MRKSDGIAIVLLTTATIQEGRQSNTLHSTIAQPSKETYRLEVKGGR